MANSAQARKRARQNEVHRSRNAAQRATMRTYIKNFLKFLETGNADEAKTALHRATAFIDRAAQKGLSHRNKASRLKSRLNARLKKAVA